MSKKVSIVIIIIIIVISLGISIYIPNREKIGNEKEDTSINYTIVEQDGKKGIKENDKIIIEPKYEKIIIPNQHRDVFLCQNGEEAKFVDKKNEKLFNEYDNVQVIEYDTSKYERNILKYEKNGKFGLLSITGREVTGAKYEELTNFSNKPGELIVKQNGEYGIIDEKGNVKIDNKYDSINSDGYYTDEKGYKNAGYIVCTTTSDGYRYGYFDSEGVQVLNEEYNELSRLTQIKSDMTYLIVAQNGQYGVFVNNTKIIDTKYQSISYNPDLQMFIVEKTGQFGAINLKGVEILQTEYSEITANGIYLYGIKGEEKLVFDENGKIVDIPFDSYINRTSSPKYFIKNEAGKYSILNEDFEVISKQKYNLIEYAYEGYFVATNEQEKVGVIDLEENIIIDFNYDMIQHLKGTSIFQARNFSTEKTDIYDREFDLALEMGNANIDILDEGVRVFNEEKEVFLDDNGKVITDESLKKGK